MVPIVISREMIKPSSPTPQHLQKMKLSYLDQIIDHVYISLIFFYQKADDHHHLVVNSTASINNNNDHHVRKSSQRLKHSLAHALTSFYPLAGRLQDNFTIDCNDAGVEFIDARAGDNHAPLMDAIQEQHNNKDGDHHHHDHYLNQYLPVDPTTTPVETTKMPFFLVQVTYFDCGGIAIGVRFFHRVADCTSIMDFISAWARVNNHQGEIITDDIQTPARLIDFDLAKYFPARDFPLFGFLMPSGEKWRTKRFVFDKVKLSFLRQLAGDVVERPSRVELVTAFLWKHIMDAHSDINKQKMLFAACHAVSLRPRKKMLENVFGNCFMMALAFEDGDDEFDFHELVRKWRSAIRVINEDYVTESSSYLKGVYNIAGLLAKGHVEWCVFSSWCGFPMYEVDFGWGKPIWWCPVGLPKDFTVFVRTRCGEGIEAWVNMDRDIISSIEAKIQAH